MACCLNFSAGALNGTKKQKCDEEELERKEEEGEQPVQSSPVAVSCRETSDCILQVNINSQLLLLVLELFVYHVALLLFN